MIIHEWWGVWPVTGKISTVLDSSTDSYLWVQFSCPSLEHTFKFYLIFLFPFTSPPGKRESLYLTESGREAFDQLYRLWEGQMRVVSTSTPSPPIPLPLDSQSQLVSDLLNVLIGVASTSFPLNQVHFTGFVYWSAKCSKVTCFF